MGHADWADLLEMKNTAVSLMLFFVLVSCAHQQESSGVVATTTPLPSPITLSTPTIPAAMLTEFAPPPRPLLTDTPLAFHPSVEKIHQIIDKLFDHNNCTRIDMLTPTAPGPTEGFLGYKLGNPELIEITNQVDIKRSDIYEIADNQNNRYRAYLVDEPAPISTCATCIQSRVYVQRHKGNQIYMINWKRYLSSRYLGRLIWVGNEVITFFQSLGPHGGELIGVDVEKQEFVYYAGLSCQ